MYKMILFVSFSTMFSCSYPKPETHSKLTLIGGRPIERESFLFSGRLIGVGNCSISKVGPRHFLTARHCTKQITSDFQLQSSKESLPSPLKFQSSTNSDSDYFSDENASVELGHNSTIPEPNSQLLNGFDWSLLALNLSGDEDEVIEKAKYLKQSWTTRKIGNPQSVLVGDTVMLAGFGDTKESDGIIGQCELLDREKCTGTKVYETSEVENTLSDGLNSKNRYAYFKIGLVGSGLDFTFSSRTELVSEKISANQTNFIFNDKASGSDKDPRGLLATGDSGSAVLNGQLEIIGIASSYIASFDGPYAFWNNFSTFNAGRVSAAIEKPWVDYLVPKVESGKHFVIYGYRIKDLKTSISSFDGSMDSQPIALDIDDRCQSISSDRMSRIEEAGMVRGEDFQCFTAPENIIEVQINFKHEEKILSTVFIPKNINAKIDYSCKTKIEIYSSVNGVPETDPNLIYPFTTELASNQTVSELKAFHLSIVKPAAEEQVSRTNEVHPDFDDITAEDCIGLQSPSGYEKQLNNYEEALVKANAWASRPVYVGDTLTCAGPGRILYNIWMASYKIGETTCGLDSY